MHATILVPLAEGGFNPLDVAQGGAFLWTVIIFVLALPFMWMVVFKPITIALYERDEKASAAAARAEQAQADAEKAQAQVEVALGEAQTEAAALMAQARERAEVRERDIVDSAKREASAMIDTARTAIQAEQEKALATIRNEVVDLSLSAASKVIGRNVGSEDDRKLVSDLVGNAGTQS